MIRRCLVTFVLFLSFGCTSGAGDSCSIDSDCDPGLLCLSGTCATSEEVSDALMQGARRGTSDIIEEDLGSDSGKDVPIAECAAPLGLFKPGTAPCSEPATKRKVISIVIVKEGGLTKLADLANPLIVEKIADETIVVDLWVDGTLSTACDFEHAWVVKKDQGINSDCTPQYGDSFPMPIPLGEVGIAIVENAEFDPSTGELTGYVNKQQLLEQVPEGQLRSTASLLVTEDADTDGDGTPDMASVRITIGLEG